MMAKNEIFVRFYDQNVTLEMIRYQYIMASLEYHRGVIRLAAQSLGTTMRTIYTFIDKYNVHDEVKRFRGMPYGDRVAAAPEMKSEDFLPAGRKI